MGPPPAPNPFGAARLSETYGFILVPTHHNSPSYAPVYNMFLNQTWRKIRMSFLHQNQIYFYTGTCSATLI